MQDSFSEDVDGHVGIEELEYLESKYNSEIVDFGESLQSPDSQFLYAWGLVRSKYESDNKHGINLLIDVMQKWPERSRDCLYYISIGYYRLKDYKMAKEYILKVLRIEPNNQQAVDLLSKIDQKVNKDGIIGMFIVGGIVAAAAGIFMTAFRNRQN